MTSRTGVPPAPGEHWSDCAVHNGPALPPGPCNCGALMTSNSDSPKADLARVLDALDNLDTAPDRVGDPCPRCGAKLVAFQDSSDKPIHIACPDCDPREPEHDQ